MNSYQLLVEAFNNTSFYILGAGASAGIIPLTFQLGERIKNIYLNYGVFPTEKSDLDDTSKRIIGNAYYSEDIFIQTIKNGPIKSIALQALKSNQVFELPPNQYYAFNLAKKSILFNFNIDGLANTYCKKHIRRHPHGSLDSTIFNSELLDELIPASIEYDIEPPNIPNLILPGKENANIITSPAYEDIKSLYPFTLLSGEK